MSAQPTPVAAAQLEDCCDQLTLLCCRTGCGMRPRRAQLGSTLAFVLQQRRLLLSSLRDYYTAQLRERLQQAPPPPPPQPQQSQQPQQPLGAAVDDAPTTDPLPLRCMITAMAQSGLGVVQPLDIFEEHQVPADYAAALLPFTQGLVHQTLPYWVAAHTLAPGLQPRAHVCASDAAELQRLQAEMQQAQAGGQPLPPDFQVTLPEFEALLDSAPLSAISDLAEAAKATILREDRAQHANNPELASRVVTDYVPQKDLDSYRQLVAAGINVSIRVHGAPPHVLEAIRNYGITVKTENDADPQAEMFRAVREGRVLVANDGAALMVGGGGDGGNNSNSDDQEVPPVARERLDTDSAFRMVNLVQVRRRGGWL